MEIIDQWLQQLRNKKGWYLVALLLSGVAWFVFGSLDHRFFSYVNDWQDAHMGVYMDLILKILIWLIDHPIIWPIVVVCVILVHAYWKRQQGKGASKVAESVESAILTMADSDPRITVEFIDEREGQLFKKNGLRLINNGGSEALDVRIEDITLRAQKVCFPHVEGSISGNGGNTIFEPVIAPYGPAIKPLLITALMNEWNSYNDLRREELLVPLTIRYANFARTFDYTTTCTLAFQAIEEGLRTFTNSKRQTVIFRDFQHNKEARKV